MGSETEGRAPERSVLRREIARRSAQRAGVEAAALLAAETGADLLFAPLGNGRARHHLTIALGALAAPSRALAADQESRTHTVSAPDPSDVLAMSAAAAVASKAGAGLCFVHVEPSRADGPAPSGAALAAALADGGLVLTLGGPLDEAGALSATALAHWPEPPDAPENWPRLYQARRGAMAASLAVPPLPERRPSKLDGLIRRMTAQADSLDWAAADRAPAAGDALVVGLGGGRTYDHLRRAAADRPVWVIERKAAAPAALSPPAALLREGEAETELARFAGAGLQIIDYDLGVGDTAGDLALAAALAPALAAALTQGGVLLSTQPLRDPVEAGFAPTAAQTFGDPVKVWAYRRV